MSRESSAALAGERDQRAHSSASPAILTQLMATAKRALDSAERAANIAAASNGETAADVLERHGWPQLDQARKALEEAMEVAFEIVQEAATRLDSLDAK